MQGSQANTPPEKRARPALRITPDLIARIADNVRLGMPLRRAAWAEGVPEHFAAFWLKAGERDDQTGPTRDFYLAMRRARAEGQRQLVANLRAAADAGNTRAAAFMLKTRYPDEFNAPDRIALDVTQAARDIAGRELAERSEADVIASLREALMRLRPAAAGSG